MLHSSNHMADRTISRLYTGVSFWLERNVLSALSSTMESLLALSVAVVTALVKANVAFPLSHQLCVQLQKSDQSKSVLDSAIMLFSPPWRETRHGRIAHSSAVQVHTAAPVQLTSNTHL